MVFSARVYKLHRYLQNQHHRTMKTFCLTICLSFFQAMLFAQTTEDQIVHPKGLLYFGAEAGLNSITSYSFDEQANSIQAGLAAEYYFANQWSLTGRVKYFKTGVSFYQDSYTNRFEGNVIAVPVTVKWEFRIVKNLRAYLKAGGAYNYETKSDYDFAEDANTGHSRSFGSINTGFGLTYFISKRLAFYLDLEQFTSGGYKGFNTTDSFDIGVVSSGTYSTNKFVNVGVKYSFKK